MKRHEIRLSCDCQFSHGVVNAGTLVGVVVMVDGKIEPTSLLSMIQFGQASIVEVESNEPTKDEQLQSSPESDSTEDNPEESDSDDAGFDDSDESEQEEAPSDLAGILDESLIESLALNGIKSKSQLLEFLAAGRNLVDLDKIGATRAKRILAAVESLK